MGIGRGPFGGQVPIVLPGQRQCKSQGPIDNGAAAILYSWLSLLIPGKPKDHHHPKEKDRHGSLEAPQRAGLSDAL